MLFLIFLGNSTTTSDCSPPPPHFPNYFQSALYNLWVWYSIVTRSFVMKHFVVKLFDITVAGCFCGSELCPARQLDVGMENVDCSSIHSLVRMVMSVNWI
jgi:hypothetical protein